ARKPLRCRTSHSNTVRTPRGAASSTRKPVLCRKIRTKADLPGVRAARTGICMWRWRGAAVAGGCLFKTWKCSSSSKSAGGATYARRWRRATGRRSKGWPTRSRGLTVLSAEAARDAASTLECGAGDISLGSLEESAELVAKWERLEQELDRLTEELRAWLNQRSQEQQEQEQQEQQEQPPDGPVGLLIDDAPSLRQTTATNLARRRFRTLDA